MLVLLVLIEENVKGIISKCCLVCETFLLLYIFSSFTGAELNPNIPLPLDPMFPFIPPGPTDRSCFGPEDCAGPCDGPEDCKISFKENPYCGSAPTCYGLDHALCIDNACQSGYAGVKCNDINDCIPPYGLVYPVCVNGECQSGQAEAKCEKNGECIRPLTCVGIGYCRQV